MARLLSDGAAEALSRARPVGPRAQREVTFGRSPEFHFAPACPTCGDVGHPHLVVRAGQISEVEGVSALTQWMRAALSTDRGRYPIYSQQFGTDYTDIMGSTHPEVSTLAQQMTIDALAVDDRVRSVEVRTTTQAVEISVATFDGQGTRLRLLPRRST